MATLYKRKNKLGQIAYYLDYVLEGKRIRKAVGIDKKLAELALAQLKLKLDRARAGLEEIENIRNIDSDDFQKQLIKYINSRYRFRTAETYCQRLTAFINFLSSRNIPIKKIDNSIVEQYITERLTQVSNRTINNDITILKTVFYKAIRLKLIAVNPFVGINSLPVQKKKPFFYTKEQIEAIFSHIPGRFLLHFHVLLDTGIRSGELALLHWSDIDAEKAFLNVTTRRSESKMRERSIPLTDRALQALQKRQLMKEHPSLVFSSMAGKPLHKNTLRNVFVRAKIRAGIRPGRVHDIRHTFASWLVQAGESIYLVSHLLGHSSVKMTEIYAHLSPRINETEKMNRVFDY